jgi:hypothetical protein
MQLNVNTDATVILTNKLEKLHKSAFPVAVRSTLNSAAKDMKKDTILKSAKDNFTQRKPSFFKKFSRIEYANGFDVKTMSSAVGFTGESQAVDDLEKQEHGGQIGSRDYTPWDEARGGSNNKSVKIINALENIPKGDIIDAKYVKFKKSNRNKKQKFVRAALMAKKLHGQNAYVLGNVWRGRQTLSRIDSISTNLLTRNIEIKRTPLYSFKEGRSVKVKGNQFMKRASYETSLKINDFYIENARKQFKKYFNL